MPPKRKPQVKNRIISCRRQSTPATPAKSKLAEISAHDPNNEDLFAELMGTSKTKPKASEIKSQEAGDATKVKTTELDVLFGKTKKPGNVRSIRASYVDFEPLEKIAGGIP